MIGNRFMLGTFALLLVGCVTINIYFPEAAAQEAADRIIDEVRGAEDAQQPQTSLPDARGAAARLAAGAARVLDLLIPAAHAQANFDATSPASRALEQSLKARFPRIKPYLDGGSVGLTAEGLLEIRDRNAIPLAERNTVRQLVTEQNADWEALYKEIARINGHPEWLGQIRQTFAQRWVAKADPGWYYRDAGGTWKQK
jgi:uncharacterized protein YdbL (DUF1318 family)